MTDAYLEQVKHQLDQTRRDLRSAEDELAQLRPLPAKLAAIRAVHQRVRNHLTDVCATCSERDYPDYEVRWPCPTIAALDGPADAAGAAKAMPLVAVSREDVEDWALSGPLTAADQRQDTPAPTVSVAVDGEWKPVHGIASVQFDGLDGIRNGAGPAVPYHPPILGTTSRQVHLDPSRLRTQIAAVLWHSTPTT